MTRFPALLLWIAIALAWPGPGSATPRGCTVGFGQTGWIAPGGICRTGEPGPDAIAFRTGRDRAGMRLRLSHRAGGARVAALSRGEAARCRVGAAEEIRCAGPATLTRRYRDRTGAEVVFRARYDGELFAMEASGGLYDPIGPPVIALELGDRRVAAGALVTLTARVSDPAATGAVRFVAGDTRLAEAPLRDGQARTRWRAVVGIHEIRAVLTRDGAPDGAGSAPQVVIVDAAPQISAEEVLRKLVPALEKDLARSLRARRRHSAWIHDQARARLRDGGTVVSARDPFMLDQEFRSGRAKAAWSGRMAYGRDRGRRGRFVYADLDMDHRRGAGPDLTFNLASVHERRLSDSAIAAVHFGLEAGRSRVGSDSGSGRIETLGLSAGGYAMRRLRGDVILDGFVEIARSRHGARNITAGDTVLRGYRSTALHFGSAISGTLSFARMTITPEFGVEHNVQWATLSLVARDGGQARRFDGARLRAETTRISATPRIRRRLDQWRDRYLEISPESVCKRATRLDGDWDCGLVLGVEYGAGFASGRGNVLTNFEISSIGGTDMAGLNLKLVLDF